MLSHITLSLFFFLGFWSGVESATFKLEPFQTVYPMLWMGSGVNWDLWVVNNSYEWVERAIVFRLGRSSRIGNRQSETGYVQPVLIPIMGWLWIIQWVPVLRHSRVLVVDTADLLSYAKASFKRVHICLCKLCKSFQNLASSDRSNRQLGFFFATRPCNVKRERSCSVLGLSEAHSFCFWVALDRGRPDPDQLIRGYEEGINE